MHRGGSSGKYKIIVENIERELLHQTSTIFSTWLLLSMYVNYTIHGDTTAVERELDQGILK